MQKRPPPGNHVLLVIPAPPASQRLLGATELPPSELILDGRRYQLVPVDETPPDRPVSPAAMSLTERELQIVSLVADGRGNKEIAGTLSISVWTVSTHLRRIFAKLGVKTRAAMVSRCFEASPPPG
ncbi:helix-turn-helix domain-containing protein [Archangium lansingense]|uniref:helix-turn-helix domain-containing protein n=1 Tax=Archangium lansingense TaxID=2995310 RepID=UPI003B811FEE